MDLKQILAELRVERDRLDKAIAALAGVNSPSRARRTARRSRISAAGRKRLSELMKKRWASGKMKRRGRAKAA